MTTKTHWKLLTNPDYIGAYWLPDGRDVTVTISHVSRDIITGTGGKKEECTVAHLQGVKPFILNATNSKSIAKLYGPFIEDWAGKQITLFASTAKLAGDTVECLRVRPSIPAQETAQKVTEEQIAAARAAAAKGKAEFAKFWNTFPRELRSQLRFIREELDRIASEFDSTANERAEPATELQ